MKSQIKVIDKSNVHNRRCVNCKYYLSVEQKCINPPSVDYQTQRFNYNICKNFEWHHNVLDRDIIRRCKLCKGVYVDIGKKAIPICLHLAKINNIQEQDYKLLWYLITCNKNECVNNFNV